MREQAPQGATKLVAGAVASERRIVALVLPDLLCELALEGLSALGVKSSGSNSPALAVVLSEPVEGVPIAATQRLDQVNEKAQRCGVRAGQTLAEARAFLSGLVVVELHPEKLELALGRVAEIALGFGTTVSIKAPDTVWVDITGAAHLVGGEQNLCEELASRVRELRHRVRVAAAAGPLLARAFARWLNPSRRGEAVFVVPSHESVRCFAELPIQALPVEPTEVAWLARVGLFRVGDLSHLPKKAAASRLGEDAARVLELCAGHDVTPLVIYDPPVSLTEELSWESPLSGVEPLLFAVRRLSARLSARLQGRGMAAQQLELKLEHDRSIARLREQPPTVTLSFSLAAPLWRDSELVRVLRARLEQTQMRAPLLGVQLSAPVLTPVHGQQLNLSRGAASIGSDAARGPEILPVLLAELGADIGPQRVGCLCVQDSHRPETQSQLGPVSVSGSVSGSSGRARPGKRKSKIAKQARPAPRWLDRALQLQNGPTPTRLLEPPVPIASLSPGTSFALGNHFFTIEGVNFEQRLELVEWWGSDKPISRDYVRVWLRGTRGGLEALAYIDRVSGRKFLQGIYD